MLESGGIMMYDRQTNCGRGDYNDSSSDVITIDVWAGMGPISIVYYDVPHTSSIQFVIPNSYTYN